jgi:tetratricopeptide (TPR) repeat protein
MFLAAGASRPTAQKPEHDPANARVDLRAYRKALASYRAGDPRSVETLRGWNPPQVEAVVALVNGPKDDTRPWGPIDIAVSALFHTDASLRFMRDHDDEAMELHLDLASRMLQKGGVLLRGFASRWYVGVARLLRDRGLGQAAENLLRLGRERLRDDPAVLYESGTISELMVTEAQGALKSDTANNLPPRTGDSMIEAMSRRRTDNLDNAARWLRQSLAGAPSNAEAALHLGRVLMLRGEDAEALRILEAIPRSATPATRYMASMFLGAVHERKGGNDAAADAYRRAIDIQPVSHAAHVALSEALLRAGRGDESRAAIEGMLALPPQRIEPWWIYFFEPSNDVSARMLSLFKEVIP